MPHSLRAFLKPGLLTFVLLLCTQSPLTAQILDDQWAIANAAYASGLEAAQASVCNRRQYDVAMEKLRLAKDTANGKVNSLNDHARRQWMNLHSIMSGLQNLIDADVSGQLRDAWNTAGGAVAGAVPFGGSAYRIATFLQSTAERLERAGAQQDILDRVRQQMDEIQTTYQQIEGWKELADEAARMEQRLTNTWFRNCMDREEREESATTGTAPPAGPSGEQPPTTTTTTPIIKATVTDPNTGQPVPGTRIALVTPPPSIPGPGVPRDDSGGTEDPSYATCDGSGTATIRWPLTTTRTPITPTTPGIPTTPGTPTTPTTPGTPGGLVTENPVWCNYGTCPLTPVPQVASASEFRDGGEVIETPTVDVEIDLPSFESYIAKIKIDKNKKAWDNPSSYLPPAVSYFVARKWIVGDSMYVVINVPTIKEE